MDLGNKFTNWNIKQTDKNESYSCVLYRNDNSTGFIQKMMGTKPEKFKFHASTKASLAPIIKDGENNQVFLKYGIYQTGLTLMNKRPNYERLCDILHSGYVKGSDYFTGMVDARDGAEYQEMVVNGNLYYQNSEDEGPYLITKGVRSRFGSAFVTDTAVWFRQKFDNENTSTLPYVLPPSDKSIRYLKV